LISSVTMSVVIAILSGSASRKLIISVTREKCKQVSDMLAGSADEQCKKVSVMLAISAVMLQGKLFSHETLAGKCETETYNKIPLVDTSKKVAVRCEKFLFTL
jgi:hypothetical protein